MGGMQNRLSSLGRSSLSWQARAFLLLLVALSFAIRLYDLEAKSLWSDEGLTLRRAEQPLRLVVQNVNLIPVDPDYQDGANAETFVRTPDLHPPLYFLLMHIWIPLAGRSEFALRFPSVVAATLAVPLFYAVGRSLFNRETGLWAALLGAVSPFYLWYAQEARMYTWLIVMSLASIYFLLPLLDDSARRRDYARFIAVTLALLYTHYAGFLLLAFELGLYAAFRLRSKKRVPLAIVAALALAVIPLVPFVWRLLDVQPFSFTYRPLGVILREASSSFSLGLTRSAVQPWWRVVPFLTAFALGALMIGVPRRRRAWLVSLGYLAIPLLIQYGLSLAKPNYMNPRHLMVVAPAFELLMAHGLTTLRRWFSPSLVLVLGLMLFLRLDATDDILTSHRFWKDDIRGAVQYIENRARPGDAIILHHPVIRLTFDYYYDGSFPEIAIPRYGNNDDTAEAQAAFSEWARRYERIWFMYGPPPTYFPHHFLPSWADENLFKVCQQEFEAWWTYVGVAAYEHSAPTLDEVPEEAKPVEETWGGLTLVGVRLQDAAAGEDAWLHLYWRSEGNVPEDPLRLKTQLMDDAGAVWYEQTHEVLPFYSPVAWPSDQIVRTELRLSLPKDLPRVGYTVGVEPEGTGDLRPVGQLQVSRPIAQAVPTAAMARFGDGIELVDVELDSDAYRAGYPLTGSVTWRASSTPDNDYALRIRLVDPGLGEVARGETAMSAAGYPTSEWEPGDPVAGRLVLNLPSGLNDGLHRVQIGLADREGGTVLPVHHWYGRRQWFTVGTVQVDVWPMMTEMPSDVDHLVGSVSVADAIRLRGYDLERQEASIGLTLYWEAQRAPNENYHVFVHVGEPGHPPLAEAGGLPVDWTRPTTSWREGEIVVDQHTVSLSGVPPGSYHVLVGLFDPATGQRPRTRVAGQVVTGGYIVLEEVDVE